MADNTIEHGKPINFRRIKGTRLFRSSRPDSTETSNAFKSAGIKTIIDLRDMSEIRTAHGCEDYQLVTPGVVSSPQQPIELKPVMQPNKSQVESEHTGKHVVVPLLRHRTMLVDEDCCTTSNIVCLAGLDTLLCCTRLARSYMISKVITRKGDEDESLIWLYKHIIDNSKRNIFKALCLLTEPSRTPAIVICAMGKDRTGVLCALIGHICGRTDDQLVADYALSQESYGPRPDHELIRGVDDLRLPQCYKCARPGTMRALLEYIHASYGSIDEYLDSIGFDGAYRESLRQNIMDKENE